MNSKSWCLVCGIRIDTGQVYCDKHGGAPKQSSLRELLELGFSRRDHSEAGHKTPDNVNWLDDRIDRGEMGNANNG
jgi:hypothetical protein